MDLGLIGNCQYNALIGPDGGVKWLCWPRFDSSFIFGELLDDVKGGEFKICPENRALGQQSYLSNSNILRTEFASNGESRFEVIDFAPRFLQNDRYFKPTMLIRMVRPLAGEPLITVKCQPTYDYGRKTLQPVTGSNHIEFKGTDQLVRLTTNGSLTMITEQRPFVLKKTLYFVLTWGPPLEASIESTCKNFFERTLEYWHRWIKHCHVPSEFQKETIRSALVLKLHQYEDTGAITAATTTSIPEAEGTTRNWDYRYCWLRDALFSILALQRLTHFEEMEGFVGYLRNIVQLAKIGDRRLQPVYAIDGQAELTESILSHLKGYRGHQPVRIGNQAFEHQQHDVYGEMVMAIAPLFLDERFQTDQQRPPKQLLEYLLERIEATLFAKDAGLWEFRGKEQIHTFTLLMHWFGAKIGRLIAKRLDYQHLLAKTDDLMKQIQQRMDNDCWDEQIGAFTQSVGSKHLDASLLMLVNFGYLKPSDPRAIRHVKALQKELQAPNGLLHRYKHHDDFGATTNAFTICSFWLVEALARVGERKEALGIFRQLLSYSNSLGLFSEDINPEDLSQWGNYPQTYSHVGLINAAFILSKPWENTYV